MGLALALAAVANSATFALNVRERLVPSLRPGQVIILDQLNVHAGAPIRAAIEEMGRRLLLLPASSPDCNPIEQPLARPKTYLRAAAARSFDDLVAAGGVADDTITPADAHGCFAHWGSHLPQQFSCSAF